MVIISPAIIAMERAITAPAPAQDELASNTRHRDELARATRRREITIKNSALRATDLEDFRDDINNALAMPDQSSWFAILSEILITLNPQNPLHAAKLELLATRISNIRHTLNSETRSLFLACFLSNLFLLRNYLLRVFFNELQRWQDEQDALQGERNGLLLQQANEDIRQNLMAMHAHRQSKEQVTSLRPPAPHATNNTPASESIITPPLSAPPARPVTNNTKASEPVLTPTISAPPTPAPTILRECGVCLSDVDAKTILTLACGHGGNCLECWKTILARAIKNNNTQEMHCSVRGCRKKLEVIDIRKINKNQKETAIIEDILSREFINSNINIKHCPTPNCEFTYIMEPDSILRITSAQITCRSCHKSYCGLCTLTHRYPITCEQAKAERELEKSLEGLSPEERTRELNNRYLISKTKPCPKCKTVIDKDGGCNHMSCKRCGHEFWWCHLTDFKVNGRETNCITCGGDKFNVPAQNEAPQQPHPPRQAPIPQAQQQLPAHPDFELDDDEVEGILFPDLAAAQRLREEARREEQARGEQAAANRRAQLLQDARRAQEEQAAAGRARIARENAQRERQAEVLRRQEAARAREEILRVRDAKEAADREVFEQVQARRRVKEERRQRESQQQEQPAAPLQPPTPPEPR